MPLDLNGTLFTRFTADGNRYGPDDRACVERTVERLRSVQTSAERPGMLLGKIQSGKTKTFLGVIALAFDNGFDVAIILTKGTKALARQTLARVRREFAQFLANDQLQMHDIMTVPPGLTGYELNQKLVFVAKKQSDNLDRLATLFRDTSPQFAGKRVLFIDDEADYASIGFRTSQTTGMVANTTTLQIDQLRTLLPNSAFLQVTATPYALYLQPEDLAVSGNAFRPVRPAFTELVPVHPDYVGSDYYFDRSLEADTVASFVYHPVTAVELSILRQSDRRRFRIEEALTSPAIPALRSALCNFIVGGIIRRLAMLSSGESNASQTCRSKLRGTAANRSSGRPAARRKSSCNATAGRRSGRNFSRIARMSSSRS